MPLAAIILGAVLLDLAFRGTEHEFAHQLSADFGQGSKFWSWAAAIGVLGALGYVNGLKTISTMALALVIVVLVLVNGGLFTQLAAVITSPPAPSPPISLGSYKAAAPAAGAASGGGSGGGAGSSSGGASGALTGAAEGAALGTAVFPGIGTAVGAVGGALFGGLS